MAADDNPLTSRATTSTRAAEPLIASGSVRPLVDALERLGHSRSDLLRATSLRDEQLADPDALVPCRVQEQVIVYAQQNRPRKNLALHVAAATPIGAYPLLDYLVLSCATVGDGLRRLSDYHRLIGGGFTIDLERDGDGTRYVLSPDIPPFYAEFGVALPLLHLHRESGGGATARFASFRHRPEDPDEFRATIRCPVRTGSDWVGFLLSDKTLALPMRRGDPILLSVLEEQATQRLADLPAEDFVSGLKRSIAGGLAEGRITMTGIARRLALTSRTLQRRLAERGTTFQQAVEETRREAAERHLAGAALSIAEISFALGYSEPAAFHRAFRRWTRQTPQEFRARARAKRIA
jgi:AraC-like DNA-binding protein